MGSLELYFFFLNKKNTINEPLIESTKFIINKSTFFMNVLLDIEFHV